MNSSLPIAVLTLAIFPSATVASTDISLSTPLGEERDATSLLLAAIEEMSRAGGGCVRIAPGTYHLFREKASEEYLRISNHESHLRRIGLSPRRLSRVEIDGQGAKIVRHGQMVPFFIEGYEDLTLHRLSIDFSQPLFLQGIVTTVDVDQQSFDLQVLPESNARVDRGRLVYGRGDRPGQRTWWQSIELSYWVDPAMGTSSPRQPVVALWNSRFKRATEATQLTPNRF